MPAGEHTRGDWHVGSVIGEGPASLHILSDTGMILATVTEKGGLPTLLIEEARANARLIAAAPDLLEACKALVDAPHQEHFAARLNDEEMAGLDAIKRAIAKAEGK